MANASNFEYRIREMGSCQGGRESTVYSEMKALIFTV